LKYICCWSGGKDSTASIILAHEHNIPLDLILFSEVMYDNRRGISGENPLHMDFIRYVAKPMFESWGYEVVILRGKTDYLDNFYSVVENPRKNIDNKGKYRGFPASKACSIKRDCKEKPIKEYLKALNEPYVQYVGICADELERLESLHNDGSKISILEELGYTQKMSRGKCEEYGLLSPSYLFSKRGGCWFCPNAKLAEQEYIYNTNPELWKEFVKLESVPYLANPKWNVYGCSLKQIDEKLYWGNG